MSSGTPRLLRYLGWILRGVGLTMILAARAVLALALQVVLVLALMVSALAGFIVWRGSMPLQTGAGLKPQGQVLRLYWQRFQKLPANCQEGFKAAALIVMPQTAAVALVRAAAHEIPWMDVLGALERDEIAVMDIGVSGPGVSARCRLPALTQFTAAEFAQAPGWPSVPAPVTR